MFGIPHGNHLFYGFANVFLVSDRRFMKRPPRFLKPRRSDGNKPCHPEGAFFATEGSLRLS
jgi:hypothetical protein